MVTKKGQKNKVNFTELISQARVAQLEKEEKQLEKEDPAIRALRMKTHDLLCQMEELAKQGKEEERRKLRNEVIVDNLRLVTQVLKKYGYFSPDKFQNGCIGLLKAAETFNMEKEVPFHNYAAFCIETEVRLAFRRASRMFESKNKGFLEFLDEPATFANGDTVDKYEMVEDTYSAQEFDDLINEAEVDTLFYDIIIPCIEEYGVRSNDIDMEKWRALEIQYFIELSMEDSQRQRITFTEMAKQLGTTPQNIRVRHKKVVQLIRERCIQYGYGYTKTATGRVRFYKEDADEQFYKASKGGKKRGR